MAVIVVGLVIAAGAFGATNATKEIKGRGACGELTRDPKAVSALQDLRGEQRQDMQAWSELYGSDRGTVEVQSALQRLRQEH